MTTTKTTAKTTATQAPKAKAPKAPALPRPRKQKDQTPCECGRWSLTADGETTPTCDSMTRSKFAPGHDARLSGYILHALRHGATLTFTPESGRALTGAKAIAHFETTYPTLWMKVQGRIG